MIKKIVVISTLFVFASSFASPAKADDRCTEVETRKAAELMETIQKKTLTPGCYDGSIRRLGNLHSVEAIPMLIELLGYQREPDFSERMGVHTRLADQYPAVVALTELGSAAVPGLMHFFGTGNPDSVAFAKGVEAYMIILTLDRVAAVRDLVTAAGSAKDEFVRAGLMSAARQGTEYCRKPGQKAVCQASLAAVPLPQ